MRDGKLEVKIYSEDEMIELYPVEDIVTYARACVGDTGYHILINNCEHFANRCTLGSHRSKQVENVLKSKASLIKKGIDMFGGVIEVASGLMSSMLGGFLGGKSSNREKNIVTTLYEPDKVRVAEIEAQTKAMVEKVRFENERLKEAAKKELVSHIIEQEKVLMQAKIEGFEYLSKSILKLGENIALLRIEQSKDLELNQNENEKNIIDYYLEFGKKIEKSNHDFELNHLPKLIMQLETYEADSVGYQTYKTLIEQRSRAHIENLNQEIEFFREQKRKRFDTNIEIRKQLERDLSLMSNKIIETVNKQSNLLNINDINKTLLNDSKNNNIEDNNDDVKAEPKLINELNQDEESVIDV